MSYEDHVRQIKKVRERARISFRLHWETDRRASIAAGTPQKRPIEMICIEVPGEAKREVPFEAHHMAQYGELYKAWKATGETPAQGTPLEDWGVLDGQVVSDLRHLGFQTVQQLADPSAEGFKKLGALAPWVKEAKNWLATKQSANGMAAVLAKLEEVTRQRDDLERQNILLCQRLEAETGVKMVSTDQALRLAQLEASRLKPVEPQITLSEDDATPETRKRGRPKKSTRLEVSENVAA